MEKIEEVEYYLVINGTIDRSRSYVLERDAMNAALNRETKDVIIAVETFTREFIKVYLKRGCHHGL